LLWGSPKIWGKEEQGGETRSLVEPPLHVIKGELDAEKRGKPEEETLGKKGQGGTEESILEHKNKEDE